MLGGRHLGQGAVEERSCSAEVDGDLAGITADPEAHRHALVTVDGLTDAILERAREHAPLPDGEEDVADVGGLLERGLAIWLRAHLELAASAEELLPRRGARAN